MLQNLFILICLGVCLAQDYDEYPQEQQPRSLSGASRFQFQQQESKTTTEAPIAILKQINKHNEDGSYTYGYEAADGSFKIETKSANGDVKGKYGYFDGERIRTVEYGADRYGFQPSGEGITVPPPVFVDERELEEYEQPQRPAQKPKYSKQPQFRPQPQANYAPIPIVEKKKPEYTPQPQQQYYDYEDEIPTTQRPAPPPRPKFQQPQQYSPSPVPPRPQFANAVPVGVTYADAKPEKPAYRPPQPSQFDAFESRQPAQFPQQEARPAPVQQNFSPNRPADFPLFTPIGARADVYKPKPQKAQQPAPRPQPSYTEAFIPEPSFQQQYNPQPQAPVQQPQRPIFAPKPSQKQGSSILDQLAKDYALPQGSAALHDISFGYSV